MYMAIAIVKHKWSGCDCQADYRCKCPVILYNLAILYATVINGLVVWISARRRRRRFEEPMGAFMKVQDHDHLIHIHDRA